MLDTLLKPNLTDSLREVEELMSRGKSDEVDKRLKEIIMETPYVSVQYSALVALGADKAKLHALPMDKVLGALSQDLQSTISTPAGSMVMGFCEHQLAYRIADSFSRRVTLDDAVHLFRVTESKKVKQLIQFTYDTNDSEEIRVAAGKALGYSNARIWMHENGAYASGCLVALTASAATVAAAGYGLYSIVEQLTK